MPVPRLRMRPWLEKQIESKAIPGLSWVNKEEKLFQIPWKHAARQGWDINKDACLFRSWAIHTGRYKEGEKEPDAKTWKANFRCAMNSLPDIREVKDKSVYKGSSAVRVYKMLPAQVKVERKERKSKLIKDAKSKLSKKGSDSSQEEIEEAVKHTHAMGDHCYTSNVYTEQEIAIANVDIMDLLESEEVTSKEWNNQLDIPLPDSTNNMYSFQVSPITSSSEEDEDDMKTWDSNAEWQHTNIDGNRYFTNESGVQNNCITEMNPVFDDLRENDLRLPTDMRTGFDIWKEHSFSWATGLSPICSL
ncbi:interferon regulatory factor 1 [Pelobates cultripes]|uniref:Interferon regulatory factor n=1 Tax=Pelobates cultripes TaxID=61616 RepID=A0AAD1RTQ8_PELCU|nr:interferon regulatory factor 1 [Pelobates cultripes]